ncbi:hypothetical protein ACOMHN_003380 [Nucella lapillus]
MNRSDGDHLKTTGEEPMETDVEEDHNKMTKTTNTSAGMTWSTGCAESSSMKSGCTPSGGEGHRDDSSYTQDSDSGGTDDTGMEEEKQMKKPSLYDARRAWKGVSLDYLKTTPACLPEDLKLERGSEHYVAIKTPFEYKKDQIPEPFNTSGRWDTDYVRMPYDYHSKCFRNGKDKDRWEVIVEALHAPIRGPFELEEAILKYNQRYINKWKFTVLHHYFIKQMSLEERNTFFETVLPMMIELTLKIKDICPKIPLLKKGEKVKKLTLSQQQIACLLANAFFCTFQIPLLKKGGKVKKLTLSQQQIACLLANAFFCTFQIPLLKKGGKVKKLTLSQQQIACLLANAFFCTFQIPLLKKGGKVKKLTLSQQQIACLLANAFFCTFQIPLLKKGGKVKKLTLSQQQIACLLANAFFCTFQIPLLKKGGKVKKLTLSQQQIACLLANAFFCTFPLRNSKMRTSSDYSDYPDINFCHLFVGDPVPRKLQKIQCIIHYFKRVLQESLTGIVTFSRQTLSSGHNWQGSMENLSQLHVSSTGTIEDNGRGMLQVDFANKYIGGGVLGHGCVQEEIRFVICPEMIVTRLFTQALDSMDCLIMTGCERYSEYKGYSDSFCWKGDFVDKTQRDKLGRLCCEVVAIDAQVFRADYYKQFKRTCVDRELNKAYCGFKTSAKEVNRSAVCTGNWGCGAFGGDKQLKALIQVMAASVAKRDVCYFTFDDEPLTRDLSEIHKRLCRERKSVGDVYSLLWDYNRALTTGYPSPGTSLFDFIHCQLDQENTAFRRQNQRDFWKSETNNSMEDSFVLSAKDLKESASWPAPGSGNFWSKATDSNRKDDFRHSHMEQKEAGSRPAPRSGSFWSQDTDSNRKDDLRQSHMEQKEAGPRPAPGSGSVSNQEADSNRKDDIRHSHMEQKEAGPRPAPGSPTLDDSDVD